jgi:hypothetical protein
LNTQANFKDPSQNASPPSSPSSPPPCSAIPAAAVAANDTNDDLRVRLLNPGACINILCLLGVWELAVETVRARVSGQSYVIQTEEFVAAFEKHQVTKTREVRTNIEKNSYLRTPQEAIFIYRVMIYYHADFLLHHSRTPQLVACTNVLMYAPLIYMPEFSSCLYMYP